jgi:hypothetical protein
VFDLGKVSWDKKRDLKQLIRKGKEKY